MRGLRERKCYNITPQRDETLNIKVSRGRPESVVNPEIFSGLGKIKDSKSLNGHGI
jgi:hypothetical protein